MAVIVGWCGVTHFFENLKCWKIESDRLDLVFLWVEVITAWAFNCPESRAERDEHEAADCDVAHVRDAGLHQAKPES